MPQLGRELVKSRAARLREKASSRRTAWLESLVGTTQRVLIENSEKGHSDSFAPVTVAGSARGEIIEARISGCAGAQLTAVRA